MQCKKLLFALKFYLLPDIPIFLFVCIFLVTGVNYSNSMYIKISPFDIPMNLKGKLDVISTDLNHWTIRVSNNELNMIRNQNIHYTIFPTPYLKKSAEDENYPSYDEITATLIALLKDSTIASMEILGESHEHRDIFAVNFSSSMSVEKKATLIVAMQHAREWASLVVTLELITQLHSRYSTDTYIKHLVDTNDIWIVPLANPDGYEYSRLTDRLWRKNRSQNQDDSIGVDLNRNWDFQFDHENRVALPSSSLYSGETAESELETRALSSLIETLNLGAVLDIHSYSQLILYPWAYSNEKTFHDSLYSTLATSFHNSIIDEDYLVGQPPNVLPSIGSGVGGSMMDYVYENYAILSMAMELPPTTEATNGFIVSYEEAQSIYTSLEPMLFSFIEESNSESFVLTSPSSGCSI